MNEAWLRGSRADLETWLDRQGLASTLSASRYLLHQKLEKAIHENAKGRILEAGAGGSPFSDLLRKVSDDLVTLDINDRYGDIDVIADVQDMPEVETASFDVVVCTQVLEHLPLPEDALREMRRVLRDDGVLILSAPHLSMVHEAPNDFFRYTSYGLKVLCESSGFNVITIEATGGLVAFVVHLLSVGLLTILGSIPGFRWPIWVLNYVVLVRFVALIDRNLGVPSLFPLDHVAVARCFSRSIYS